MVATIIKCFVAIFSVYPVIEALSVPAALYQSNAGLLVENWFSYTGIKPVYWENSQSKTAIHGLLECPNITENKEKFESSGSNTRYVYTRYRAYFIAPATGNHKFFVDCKYYCKVSIGNQPGTIQSLYHENFGSFDWSKSKWSNSLSMQKGFRYKIEVLNLGRYNYFLKLGVQFPNGTQMKPLDKTVLRRSMEFYAFKGILHERFDSISFPITMTFPAFLSNNAAKYPSNPSTTQCRLSLNDSTNSDYFAIRYTGYFKPDQSTHFTFKIECDDFCEFNFTKEDNTVITTSASNSEKIVSVGGLVKDKYYKMELFLMERAGAQYVRVTYKKTGSYTSHFTNMLQNLLPSETNVYIPYPVVAAINSTAISVKIPSLPTIPPGDKWSSTSAYDIVYYKQSDTATKMTVAVTGALPLTKIFDKLSKYTVYAVYLHYYGNVESTIEHNIISGTNSATTHEDVPEAYPTGLYAIAESSNKIRVGWNALSSSDPKNGIIRGYEVRYAAKNAVPKTWTPYHVIGSSRLERIRGLKNYTTYEFRVAAKTSKGSGVFSPLVERRTLENVPSAPPSNITGQNTSSTSLKITWEDVPPEHQNGIILDYKVYIKLSTSGSFPTPTIVSSKSYERAGLQYWTIYDIRIAARTSIGTGEKSNILQLRTDEDTPTAAPASFMAYGITDAKIALQWKEISTEYRNGIITGYSIMFKKTTAKLWQEIKVPAGKTTWTTDALILSTSYELKIAGKTAGGIGNYSDVIVVKTDAGRLIEVMPTAYFTSLDFTDKVLTKHISKTIQVTTIEQCFRACLDCMKPNSGCSCSSFNIRRPSSPSTSFTCEINASDHDACPFDFVKETGYQYYQIL